ncbi:MAG: hypothetical protein U9Q06_00200 [Nanoarchaeota archaeon]|nr:hypothetical protein [Nanoarchaeota archaeon]
MTALDNINNMKMQGYSDSEITSNLQQKGISPREINDALNQSSIKQAVSENSSQPVQNFNSTQEVGGGMAGMQPSVADQQVEPQLQEQSALVEPGPIQPITQEYMPQGELPPEQDYQDQDYGYDYPQGGGQNEGYGNNDMVTEIINQVTNEKISKVNQHITSLVEFKSLLTTKVEKMDERLKQIEAIIDQLQMSLVRKAGEQEQNISDIKSEMNSMQNSFGKLVNPLTDTIREMEEVMEKPEKKSRRKSSRKKK